MPNGFGQITEIRGKYLRKPFRVLITVGKDGNGRPVCKPLKPEAYFETYNDAYAALVEYNKNPYDLDDSITVEELYARWLPEFERRAKNNSSVNTVKAAWKYCSGIYKIRVIDIRPRHLKSCMENGTAIVRNVLKTISPGMKVRLKNMFNSMFDYAVEHEMVDRNWAREFSVSKDVLEEVESLRESHNPFTDDELKILWDNLYRMDYVDVVLIQCYSGWRPTELGLIRLDRVDLDHDFFTGGIKTKAGINRAVPIHPAIRDLVKRRYDEAVAMNSEYLINCTDIGNGLSDIKFTYSRYQSRFEKIVATLFLSTDHKPHDPRMTFVTAAKKCGIDEYAIKYIVGHHIDDVTEAIYTKRDPSWLADEIQKIKGPEMYVSECTSKS